MSMPIPEIAPHTKNWIQDILTPSTTGEKKSMMMIWTEKSRAHTSISRSPLFTASSPPVMHSRYRPTTDRPTAPTITGLHFFLRKSPRIGTMMI